MGELYFRAVNGRVYTHILRPALKSLVVEGKGEGEKGKGKKNGCSRFSVSIDLVFKNWCKI
jgi:hypothetical protein